MAATESSTNPALVETKNSKEKHVTFRESMLEQVKLRSKKNDIRRSQRKAMLLSTVQEQLLEEHDFWFFKIKKSSLIKLIMWITLVILFFFGYFLDIFQKFYDERTDFSFYKRKVEMLEAPALTICTNPGFKASVLEKELGQEYDELGDYVFMSQDYINATGVFNETDSKRYYSDHRGS